MTLSDKQNAYNFYRHESVMLKESISPLLENEGNIYVDCTLGGGGHTAYLLAEKNKAKIFAFDRDPIMIQRAQTRFQEYIQQDRLVLIHANYSDLRSELKKQEIHAVDGILLDAGVSSFQLDIPERGFSFMKNGPLDMRMNPEEPESAYDIVNYWAQSELERIFFQYGEEKFSRKIAGRIIEARAITPIADTATLSAIIEKAIPRAKRDNIHPSTRVFQALRIAVNRELEGLEKLLQEIPDMLNPGGVFSAISFHSLEDRLVKERLKHLSANCICPPEIITCERCNKPFGTLVQQKPLLPTAEEKEKNPRSRSAKLRIFTKNKRR